MPGGGTSGDDDMRRFDDLAGNLHPPAIVFATDELAASWQQGDFVLLEQSLDATGQLGDDVVLALDHRGHIHLHVTGADAVHDKGMPGLIEQFGRLQQRLGGNATDVEAGAAESNFSFRVSIRL